MGAMSLEEVEANLTSLQLPGASETAASFAFEKEDHTLGNALRYVITKKYAVATGFAT